MENFIFCAVYNFYMSIIIFTIIMINITIITFLITTSIVEQILRLKKLQKQKLYCCEEQIIITKYFGS